MRLLLDTNILIGLTPLGIPTLEERFRSVVSSRENSCFASIVCLWEVAIKSRLRKLDIGLPPHSFADYLDMSGIPLLPITREHVLADIEPEPRTRDPFDRLLLAICQVEGLRLLTRDRVLAAHPMAWRP